MGNLGRHGLPLFLGGDWNDTIVSITKKPGAESAFVFFQLGHAVRELIALFEHAGLPERLAWAKGVYDDCRSKVDTVWDGQWFLRAFTGDGVKYGTHEDELNRIFLNPQSWAVLSGLCSRERALAALDSFREYLNTDLGVMANYPATSTFDPARKLYFWNPAGWAENGGIFNHTNTWLIIAEALMGRAEHAWEYYRKVLPPKRNDAAEECKVEPYVYCQSMNSPQHASPRVANNSWLTGTASWMFYAATQYILGIRPDYDGLVIDPCIPAAWNRVRVERVFRGTRFVIDIRNDSGGPGRVRELDVDGDVIKGNLVGLGRFGNAAEAHVTAEITQQGETNG
jgi:cellobiose phosphorylase